MFDRAQVVDHALVFYKAQIFGDALVCDNARILGSARVYDNAVIVQYAQVTGCARVYGQARISGTAVVGGYSRIYDNVDVTGMARIGGDAVVRSKLDYMVFKNCWSSGRSFTWTRSNDKYSVGCFYGSGKELIEKAFEDSRMSGVCYEAIVRAVEIIKLELG